MREFAELAHPGRRSIAVHVTLRRLNDLGNRLRMTPGDTVRLANETLRALDLHGELQPAIEQVLAAFDGGQLMTEVREPMRLHLDRSAVSALAVAVCEMCRPNIAVRESETQPSSARSEPAATAGADERESRPQSAGRESDVAPVQVQYAAHWPERTRDGYPRMTLDVEVWWPGLSEWEPATLTASVSKSLAFSGENFTLLIAQEGDTEPARTNAVWLLKRDDLGEDLPVYELRASTWQVGEDDAHRYRFLIASRSPWCEELHEYLAARWISRGESPTGPEEFDSVKLGEAHPPVRRITHITAQSRS